MWPPAPTSEVVENSSNETKTTGGWRGAGGLAAAPCPLAAAPCPLPQAAATVARIIVAAASEVLRAGTAGDGSSRAGLHRQRGVTCLTATRRSFRCACPSDSYPA